MPPKDPPPKRNALDFILPGTNRGAVVSFEPMPPDYVTELRDNPDDFSNPLKVGRMLPGRRVALTLSGWPFKFIVRVVPDEDGKSQVVDLRIGVDRRPQHGGGQHEHAARVGRRFL